jgi:hypothetical protein
MLSAASDSPKPPTLTMDDGDAAAREGRWSDAVAIWIGQRGNNTTAAEQRLRWFLANVGITPIPAQEPARTPWSIILGATVLGLLGTAIVLVGENVDGAAAVATSVAAWACYLASGILILMYAHARHVAARDGDHLSQRELMLAIETARDLDAMSPASHPPS